MCRYWCTFSLSWETAHTTQSGTQQISDKSFVRNVLSWYSWAQQRSYLEKFNWPKGAVRVVFATTALGMGVNLKRCEHYLPLSSTPEHRWLFPGEWPRRTQWGCSTMFWMLILAIFHFTCNFMQEQGFSACIWLSTWGKPLEWEYKRWRGNYWSSQESSETLYALVCVIQQYIRMEGLLQVIHMHSLKPCISFIVLILCVSGLIEFRILTAVDSALSCFQVL